MAIYQCFFYWDGIIGDWENIEAQSESYIREALLEILRWGPWDLAEAWLGNTLSFRIEALAPLI